MMRPHGYQPGDRVEMISGPWTGRTGTIKKLCSDVFPEYVRVFLDRTKRERTDKVEMIHHAALKRSAVEKPAPAPAQLAIFR